MSRKQRLTSWQRELYELSYRWVRLYGERNVMLHPNPPIVNTLERQKIFVAALISRDQFWQEPSGWRNHLRMAQFDVVRPQWDYVSDIPF